MTKHRPLPLRWTAPEVLRTAAWTQKSDVWSYGILLWELFNDALLPFTTLEDAELVPLLRDYGTEAARSLPLPMPDHCPLGIRQLHEACLSRSVVPPRFQTRMGPSHPGSALLPPWFAREAVLTRPCVASFSLF